MAYFLRSRSFFVIYSNNDLNISTILSILDNSDLINYTDTITITDNDSTWGAVDSKIEDSSVISESGEFTNLPNMKCILKLVPSIYKVSYSAYVNGSSTPTTKYVDTSFYFHRVSTSGQYAVTKKGVLNIYHNNDIIKSFSADITSYSYRGTATASSSSYGYIFHFSSSSNNPIIIFNEGDKLRYEVLAEFGYRPITNPNVSYSHPSSHIHNFFDVDVAYI